MSPTDYRCLPLNNKSLTARLIFNNTCNHQFSSFYNLPDRQIDFNYSWTPIYTYLYTNQGIHIQVRICTYKRRVYKTSPTLIRRQTYTHCVFFDSEISENTWTFSNCTLNAFSYNRQFCSIFVAVFLFRYLKYLVVCADKLSKLYVYTNVSSSRNVYYFTRCE